MYLIKEASQLSGVTIRTLHHYDKMGLIKAEKAENGYRYYTNDDIEKIKIIRYYRLLGFSLGKIKKIINGEDFDIINILESQLTLLSKEQEKIDLIIENIKQTLESKKESESLQNSNDFRGFTVLDNIKYQDEALEEFGKIGKAYYANQEFRNNIDKFGEGLAKYISEAITYFVANK